MNYLEDLLKSYDAYNNGASSLTPRLEFLGSELFSFATNNNYDLLEEMAYHTVNVIEVLNHEDVGSYVQDETGRYWFTIVRNLAFFKDRIAWGGKDNFGWDEEHKYVIKDVDIIIKGKSALDRVKLSYNQWNEFMQAVVQFAQPEMQAQKQRYIGKRR